MRGLAYKQRGPADLSDAYLAAEDFFELHCYTCVAVLLTCKEYVGTRTIRGFRSKNDRTLEELDSSEAKLMLLDLPPLDIDRVRDFLSV